MLPATAIVACTLLFIAIAIADDFVDDYAPEAPAYEVPVTPHNEDMHWDKETWELKGGPDEAAIDELYQNLAAQDAPGGGVGDRLPDYKEAIRDPTAPGGPPDVRSHYDEFARLDGDGDGKLSESELAASVGGEGVGAREVEVFLQELDGVRGFNRGNGDGYVDWPEYARALFGMEAPAVASQEEEGEGCRCCCEKKKKKKERKKKKKGKQSKCFDDHCNAEGGHAREACCELGGGCTWAGPTGGPCTKKERKKAGRKTQRQRDLEYARAEKWKEDKPKMMKRHGARAAAAANAEAVTPGVARESREEL